MKRARRFPRLVSGLVRWTSLCVLFTFVLSFLAVVPFPQVTTSHAQGQGSPNGQGTRVPTPPPVVGPPAADLPNIDEVRRRQPDPPEAPPHLPSMIRSRRNPIEPRNGRRVGDPGTTMGAIGASERKKSDANDAEYLAKGANRNALRASANTFATSALNFSSSIARGRNKLNHARTKARAAAPSPIGDDQYVQNFFQYALNRQPSTTGTNELGYWDDVLRAGYAKGQTSMVMAARELGKTLFESAEYAGRNTSNHDYVQDLYETYLLREPDSGGWAYWESVVPSIGREATRRAFDECGEFIYWVSTVTPNGSASSAVSSLISARVDPNNQPGDQLLARDCEWGVSLFGLPGRADLDLGLGLFYSSLVWTRSGPYLYFDEDNGWPSPGFRLGFATIQEKYFDAQSGANVYLLIGSSGGRVELRQVGTSNVYEAADSSYLQLTDNGTSLLLRTTDGTQMSYSKFENEWRCTQIKDRNGNFITVNYDWHGHITNITDTLSRVVTFNYDVNANLISITQTWNGQTHTWATFGWGTVTIQTSFSGVAVSGAPNGTVVPVLNMVGFDDGTYSKFLYNAYGQVTRVTSYASDSNPLTDLHPRSYTAYDYGATDDITRIIAARVWAENWSNLNGVPSEVVTQFSVPGDGSHQLTAPDGTIYKEFYGTGWQKGLTTQTEDWLGGVRQKWTTIAYTQDNTNVSYQTNPRVTETNVYDAAGNRRRTTVSYYTFTRPSGVSASVPLDVTEFAADAQTTLRWTRNGYDLSSAYLNLGFLGLLHEVDVYDGSNNLMSMTSYWYDWGAEHLQNQPGGVNPPQHDSSYNTSFTTRGNLCNIARHDVNDPNHPAHEFKYGYNTAGSVIFTRDHLWHQNLISYTDGFSDSVNRNSFAYPTTLTDADGYSSYLQYNYDFGAKTRTQGPPPAGQSQGVIQTLTYDSAARLQRVTTTNNGAYTRYVYGPTYVQNYATVNTVADEAYSIQTFDGAGRVIGTAGNHPGSTGGYRAVNTIYDLRGQAFKVSNPTETNASWSPTGDDAAGWVYTQQTYDWKARPLVTTNTDGTQKSITYSACGCAGSEVTTLTDEGTLINGVMKYRQQKIYSDVLGRTAKTEILNWDGSVYSTTANIYNARDQITKVNQYQGVATSDLSCPTNDGVNGTDTSWKQTLTPGSGWQNAGFNDSSWSSSVDEGGYGVSPWGSSPSFPAGTPAHWIWYRYSNNSSDNSTVYFRKTFVAHTTAAWLTLRADDNSIAYLNGVQVASTSNWQQVQTASLYLTPGTTYVLAIQVTNTGGPGGLVADIYSGGNTCQQSTITYDGYGRLSTKHLPEQRVDPNNTASTDHTTLDYNADDTIQKVTDARGASATYSYNNRHLVTGISYNAPTGSGITIPATISYGYDAAGNRTSMTDGFGSKTYSYNQLSQLMSEGRTFTGVGTFTLNYDYNLAGEIRKITDPTNVTINYGFDSTGQLSGVTGSDNLYAGVSSYASNFQYRAWGAAKHLNYGNSLTVDLGYNNRLQTLQYDLKTAGGAEVVGLQYRYTSTTTSTDNDGRLKYSHDLVNSNLDRTYSYDQAARLTVGDTANGTLYGPYSQSYGYDPWGNLTNRSWRTFYYNGYCGCMVPQWTSFSANYSNNRETATGWNYDADGRLVSSVDGSVSFTYGFDAAGQLISSTEPGRTISQGLDGDGLRAKWVENGVITYYVRSSALGNQTVVELNQYGQKVRGYVYGSGQEIAKQEGGQVLWAQRDASGVSMRLTNATGGVASKVETDPLGTQVDDTSVFNYNGGGNGYSFYPNGFYGDPTLPNMGCSEDGFEADCNQVMEHLRDGISVPCPNNDCGPRSINGSWYFFHYTDNGAGWMTNNQFFGVPLAGPPRLVPHDPNRPPNNEIEMPLFSPRFSALFSFAPQNPIPSGPPTPTPDPGDPNNPCSNYFLNEKIREQTYIAKKVGGRPDLRTGTITGLRNVSMRDLVARFQRIGFELFFSLNSAHPGANLEWQWMNGQYGDTHFYHVTIEPSKYLDRPYPPGAPPGEPMGAHIPDPNSVASRITIHCDSGENHSFHHLWYDYFQMRWP